MSWGGARSSGDVDAFGSGRRLTLEHLRSRGESLLHDVSLEYYLAHSGHKTGADLQPIYARHEDILNDESLALTRELLDRAPPGTREQSSARFLLDWQIESHAARELADIDERIISWEGTAAARLPDGSLVPYQRLMIDISNAADRSERLVLEKARSNLVAAELGPVRADRIQREIEVVESLDLGAGYLNAFGVTSGIDLPALLGECRAFLNDTAAMWREVLNEYIAGSLGIPPAEATRADALYLFRASEYDTAFPGNRLVDTVRAQVNEMGLDITAAGRITLDVDDREGKRSRAFCAPARVPDEVYLVIRPQGGRNDYRTFLHELGHALHFAHVDRTLPFEFRWLGDNSVTEGFAMLFDHLVQNDGWLGRYVNMPRGMREPFMRRCGFEELHYVRRYCAKILFEAEAYKEGRSLPSCADRFVDIMTDATGFRYDACDAFVDFDPRFYSARYLRAWMLQALLGSALRDRFDADWYRNPRCGPWLTAELMSHGQRELADELALRASGAGLSFGPLRQRIEELLS